MIRNPPPIDVKKTIQDFFTHQEYNFSTTLCAIMTSFGSDKGAERHNYTTLYSKLFYPWKNEKIYLFELGIGTNNRDVASNMGSEGQPGASLYGWSLFFPKANIYGADIDKRILFNEKKIKTFYCDQQDPVSIQKLFSHKELKDIQFDIMIEDGLHEFEAHLKFLKNSLSQLRKGGIYIAEDLIHASQMAFLEMLPDLKKLYALEYIDVINLPFRLNRYDNSLLVIQK